MDTAERVAHWVRPNEANRVPRRNIFLHVVPRSRTTKDGAVKSWGVAVATFRAAPKGRKPAERTEMFTSPDSLWAAIADHCIDGARTVLWAHNLGYGLRLTDCLSILSGAGWDLVGHNLAPKGTWLIWKRGKTSLHMCDVSAVFPKLLPQIGQAFGIGFPETEPLREAPSAALERCRVGELIVRTAMTAYLAWLEDAGLGNWQLTGAGQSYAAFRHRFLTHPMLVHDDPQALAMERAAMWTGRCEAYWHGSLRREVVHEWDFTSSYASICAEETVPTKLVGPMSAKYPWRRFLRDPKVGFVARVRVTTEQPTVPTRHNGRILWPVGSFESTLWDCEIAAALDDGAQIEVISGFLYRKTPALKAWAEWILSQLLPGPTEPPAWQKIVLKHWSTAAIGRFGMMFPEWEEVGRASKIGVLRRTCVDMDSDERYEIMQVGRTLYRQGALVEWQHSQPAITGYVMAAARVRLWRLLRAMPPRMALYADTDSILTIDTAEPVMSALAATDTGRGLRLKRSWDGFTILGPRQLVTGQRIRISGVPVTARAMPDGGLHGAVWESLAVAMSAHRSDQVRVSDRVWHVKGSDRRRNGPSLGWTEPIRIGDTA